MFCFTLYRLLKNNPAFKQHVPTLIQATKALVKSGLEAAGLTITSEGSLSAEEIDSKKLIDQHYYAIASKVAKSFSRP